MAKTEGGEGTTKSKEIILKETKITYIEEEDRYNTKVLFFTHQCTYISADHFECTPRQRRHDVTTSTFIIWELAALKKKRMDPQRQRREIIDINSHLEQSYQDHTMNNLEPKQLTCIMSTLNKVQAYASTIQWFERANKLSIKTDNYHYSIVITACPRSNDFYQALRYFEDMKREHIKPNTITYNAAISACEKGSQWEKALQLLTTNATRPHQAQYYHIQCCDQCRWKLLPETPVCLYTRVYREQLVISPSPTMGTGLSQHSSTQECLRDPA